MSEDIINLPPTIEHQPVVVHRLTVVEHVYHQINGGEPANIPPSGFVKNLTVEEEAYTNPTIRTKSELVPLDCGWLSESPISLLLIKSKEDGKLADKDQTIELWMNDFCFAEIPSGESCRFRPKDISLIKVRSNKPAKYTLSLIPG